MARFLWSWPHGTYPRYQQGCQCEPCLAVGRAGWREHNLRHGRTAQVRKPSQVRKPTKRVRKPAKVTERVRKPAQVVERVCPTCEKTFTAPAYKATRFCSRACVRRVIRAKHGTRTYYNHYGCRCSACRAENNEYALRIRSRRRAASPESNPSLKHGSPATYGNHGCRCDRCAEAWKIAMQKQAQRRRERMQTSAPESGPGRQHGKVATYRHWGCRCAACREAVRVYRKGLRERQGAVA